MRGWLFFIGQKFTFCLRIVTPRRDTKNKPENYSKFSLV